MDIISAKDLKAMRKHAGSAAAMMAVLSNEARLRVLCDLIGGERMAGELVERSGLSQSALSQHLSKLRDEGLVATRREGVSIFYRISNPDAARILIVLHEIYCKR
ncbi:MAG: metalloregulator ArsR/SmtB family transcription factor [Pseudomonadota bacterium]